MELLVIFGGAWVLVAYGTVLGYFGAWLEKHIGFIAAFLGVIAITALTFAGLYYLL